MIINPDDNYRYFPTELLVIAPLLALSTTLLMGLVMGILFALVLVAVALCVSMLKGYIISNLRLPVIFIILATLITCVELAIAASSYQMQQGLGIYLPLIAINALVLSISEEHFLRLTPKKSIMYAFRISILVLVLACIMGITREFIVTGGLLTDVDTYFTTNGFSEISIFDAWQGLTLMGKPAGALILFGLLLGTINYLCPSLLKLSDPGS